MIDSYRTAKPEHWKTLKANSRANRKEPTAAEYALWQAIRRRQLGWHFRRQHAIEGYIADFVCLSAQLVVEVDGGYHAEPDQALYDEKRDRCFESHGFLVLRVSNEDVNARIETVLQLISEALATNVSVPFQDQDAT